MDGTRFSILPLGSVVLTILNSYLPLILFFHGNDLFQILVQLLKISHIQQLGFSIDNSHALLCSHLRDRLHYVTQPCDIGHITIWSLLIMGWEPSRQNQEGGFKRLVGWGFLSRGKVIKLSCVWYHMVESSSLNGSLQSASVGQYYYTTVVVVVVVAATGSHR